MSVIVKGGGGENVTPEVTAQTPVITQILEGLVGKAQGANATADKILEGYSAYVGGQLVNGEYDPATADPDLIPENIREGIDIFGVLGTMVEGVPGIDFGEITLTADYASTLTIEHNLKVTPKYFAIIHTSSPLGGFTNAIYSGAPENNLQAYVSGGNCFKYSLGESLSPTNITLESSVAYRKGTYLWVAIS